MAPKATVVMSVHNGDKYLRESVESILNQTFADFEFIIVDDGSTDGTATILDGYTDSRIVRLHNPQCLGPYPSANRALAVASGEFVARQDADDVSLPERLAQQVNFLEEHPEVGVVGAAVQIIDGSGNASETWRFPSEHGVLKWDLCFGNPIMHSTVMMSREVVNGVNGYDIEMEVAMDYDLWRRLSRVTRLANLRDVLLFLRRHEDSVTSRHLVEQRNNSIRISQLAIAETLGEDVPLEVVQRLWAQEFETSNELLQIARLIYRLCQATVSDRALPSGERRTIRTDAAKRLFGLARPRIRDVRVWEVFGLACLLDPPLAGRKGVWQFHRIIGGRLRR
jgi:glycosyltransferase involved in cell wall biosynthesis